MLLELKNIEKQYASHRALDDVSLSVSSGSIYGLLGHNGAGKTTLIRIITQIISADKGLVLFKGKPITRSDVFRIGYLPEERGLYKNMKVWDHAMFIAQIKGLSKKQAEQQLNIWFDRYEITDWKNKKIQELSKGMQQKIQFLTTIIHQPDLLILDEPFSGFDPINTQILKDEIVSLKEQGKTVILSTHNMESVEVLCDGISLINKSKIILQGNVGAIKEQFKTDVLKLRLRGKAFLLGSPLFEILSLSVNESLQTTDLRIKKKNNISNSDILKNIVEEYDVVSCQEETMSMNDIFIHTVKSV